MLKSAWRGVRSRGWAGLFVVGLLAVALASSAVVFAFADSLVFRRDPFPGLARLVTLSGKVDSPERLDMSKSAALLNAWGRQSDVFAAIGAAANKTLFLLGNGPAEMVRTEDVTIGFLDVLGAAPRWGRKFTAGDERDPGAFTVIISEDLARRRFGDPSRAPGQTLDATAGKLVVVGVMERSFVYPTTDYHIWRALDPVGPLTRNASVLFTYARVAPGVPMAQLGRRLEERARAIGATVGLSTYKVEARAMFREAPADHRTMVMVLMGAALSLLLAACANVASLELAGAVRRARSYAVRRALGASAGRLAGQAALEGVILISTALAGGVGIAWMLIGVLEPHFPDSLRLGSNHPVDLDRRALAVMAILAATAWVVAALPPIVAATRSTFVSLLKVEDRGSAASRGALWLRRALTASEVAIAVVLVVGGLLYARSYQNLLAVEKGFDSRSLFSVDWTMPVGFSSADLSDRAVQYLQQSPGVDAVTTSSPPPSKGDSPSQVALEIDGLPPMEPGVLVGRKSVDSGYFSVIRLPVLQGRLPEPGDPVTNVVVPEQFAHRFFADGQAVGRTFRRSARDPWNTVVAVVGDFRTDRTRMPQAGDLELFYYSIYRPVATTPQTPGPSGFDAGSVTRFLTLTVRTNGRTSEAQLLARARDIEPRLPVTVSSIDEEYAKQSEDTRLASQIVGGFSVLAFMISMTGVFGVMAFLVAGRTREISIRMALGADPGAVRRMVLASSAWMVALGAGLGLILALISSRWIQSQLFGISPTDPVTYALAATGVVAVALLATWHPACQAARVDPAVTLRSE